MTHGLSKGIWCHVWLHFFFLCLQITKSVIMSHTTWAVSLVIADGHLTFHRGLSGSVWVNHKCRKINSWNHIKMVGCWSISFHCSKFHPNLYEDTGYKSILTIWSWWCREFYILWPEACIWCRNDSEELIKGENVLANRGECYTSPVHISINP